MKLITYQDITSLNITPVQCYEWVSEMIKNKNLAQLPPKISLQPFKGAFCNIMPCILPNAWGGVKVVTRYPERKPGLDSKLLLMNMETGSFLALLDANWITAMRTGAVAAHSIKLLAKKDFQNIGLIGLGNTARAAMLVLEGLFPNRKLNVKLLKYKGQEENFIKRFEGYPNLSFLLAEKPEQLVKGSDVVICAATYLAEDICPDHCFEEGVLVVPVHTRGFTNCDLFFDKVYADDRGHVRHFKNFDKFRSFAQVCDVINGNALGRENDQERILAYNIGLSIHDINFAGHIYQLLEEKDLIEIDTKEPLDKFWI